MKSLACPQCSGELSVPKASVDTVVTCSHCGKLISIPAAAVTLSTERPTNRSCCRVATICQWAIASIVVFLAAILVCWLLGVGLYPGFRFAPDDHFVGTAKCQVRLFQGCLRMYEFDTGDFPTTQQGLAALWRAPPGLANPSSWDGPYSDRVQLDPWGNAYQYQYPGRHKEGMADVWSFGPDRIDGTADDISSWTLDEIASR